jgi:hypothetical protein
VGVSFPVAELVGGGGLKVNENKYSEEQLLRKPFPLSLLLFKTKGQGTSKFSAHHTLFSPGQGVVLVP